MKKYEVRAVFEDIETDSDGRQMVFSFAPENVTPEMGDPLCWGVYYREDGGPIYWVADYDERHEADEATDELNNPED